MTRNGITIATVLLPANAEANKEIAPTAVKLG
jgi:hypothetical protein